mmetsp:Transcript_42071/g.70188  ORF Transcript_42071/g.70188 Transcript_42071/m.70188 type:complete len:191 (+) Transcript_42071:289-861(+)
MQNWGLGFGIFQAFDVTGTYGGGVAGSVWQNNILVNLGFIVCGVLSFLLSLVLSCCGEASERLQLPSSFAYASKFNRLFLKDTYRSIQKPKEVLSSPSSSSLCRCCAPVNSCISSFGDSCNAAGRSLVDAISGICRCWREGCCCGCCIQDDGEDDEEQLMRRNHNSSDGGDSTRCYGSFNEKLNVIEISR